MVYKTAKEVLEKEYSQQVKMKYDSCTVEEGTIEVLVVHTEQGYAVWNICPLRKGWQKVYTLEHCNPQEQIKQSLEALKRLFENEGRKDD